MYNGTHTVTKPYVPASCWKGNFQCFEKYFTLMEKKAAINIFEGKNCSFWIFYLTMFLCIVKCFEYIEKVVFYI